MTDPLAATTPPRPQEPLGTRDDPIAFDGVLRAWRADPLPPPDDCSEAGLWRYSLAIQRLEAARPWAVASPPGRHLGLLTLSARHELWRRAGITCAASICSTRPSPGPSVVPTPTTARWPGWASWQWWSCTRPGSASGGRSPHRCAALSCARASAWGALLVRIADGHHRGAALYRAGVREVLVWVNLLETARARGDADPDEEECGA